VSHNLRSPLGEGWLKAALSTAARFQRWLIGLRPLLLVGLVAALLLLALTLLAALLWLARFSPLITFVAGIGFGLYGGWLCWRLCDIVWPDRRLYRQLVETYSQIIRSVPDQELLLDRLAHTLYRRLGLSHLSVWRYQAEDDGLVLARLVGRQSPAAPAELPLDCGTGPLTGVQSVSSLPASACRQGLAANGVAVVASLTLAGELVGLVGLGGGQLKNRPSREAERWLAVMAGEIALAIKSAYLVKDLQSALVNLKLAYRRTIDAQDEERRRLAVELHDDILSRLTTLGLTLHRNQPGLDAPARLELPEQEIQAINRRLREITQGLHPSVLADLGLIAALQAELDSLARRGLPASAPESVTLTAQGFNGSRLAEPNLERDLYYITRQALDNAVHHARARQVFIHLRWREDLVSVTVRDTGQGMKAAPEQLMGQNGRLGLLSMNERALSWHGRLTFHTAPGQGTIVQARLPVNRPSPHPDHLQAFTRVLRPTIHN
jgi:signal transduction histidine kinase